MELRAINEDNYKECMEIRTSVENAEFVDSVEYSLAEAYIFQGEMKPFGIYDNDGLIGFVSMYVGDGNPQIINFLIDERFRGKGFGTKAAHECIRYLQKEYGAVRVSAPVNTENLCAQRFWSKLGFVPSDTVEDGYVFMRLHLFALSTEP